MNTVEFCKEKSKESRSGRISFYKKDIYLFIKKFTIYDCNRFSNEGIKRIMFFMINITYSKYGENEIEFDEFILKEYK